MGKIWENQECCEQPCALLWMCLFVWEWGDWKRTECKCLSKVTKVSKQKCQRIRTAMCWASLDSWEQFIIDSGHAGARNFQKSKIDVCEKRQAKKKSFCSDFQNEKVQNRRAGFLAIWPRIHVLHVKTHRMMPLNMCFGVDLVGQNWQNVKIVVNQFTCHSLFSSHQHVILVILWEWTKDITTPLEVGLMQSATTLPDEKTHSCHFGLPQLATQLNLTSQWVKLKRGTNDLFSR